VVHREETGLSETEVDLQAAKQRPPWNEPVWRHTLMICTRVGELIAVELMLKYECT
jgi:hypothetical protein